MTQATVSPFVPGFWESELLNILLPQAPPATQDADLVRQLAFVPGLKELLMLRQVHALEHATVWVLSSHRNLPIYGQPPHPVDDELLGGMSTDQGFYLYGQVHTDDLSWAAQTALRRLTQGEWKLAIHPRCGTNLSVGIALTAGLALGASVLLPRSPFEQLMGIGIAAMTAAQLTPDLGSLVQQYVTTAIPFNLAIAQVTSLTDALGRPAHFVRVRWVD